VSAPAFSWREPGQTAWDLHKHKNGPPLLREWESRAKLPLLSENMN